MCHSGPSPSLGLKCPVWIGPTYCLRKGGPRTPGDPGAAQAELNRGHRRPDRPVHPARTPKYVRSDSGSEFAAQAVRDWIAAAGAKTACIEPGSPWENGYVESFNARFRDELLNREIFYSLLEAQIIIKGRRKHDNTKRPSQCLGLPTIGSGSHRLDGPQAYHAPTFNLDHLRDAAHCQAPGKCNHAGFYMPNSAAFHINLKSRWPDLAQLRQPLQNNRLRPQRFPPQLSGRQGLWSNTAASADGLSL